MGHYTQAGCIMMSVKKRNENVFKRVINMKSRMPLISLFIALIYFVSFLLFPKLFRSYVPHMIVIALA